MKLLSCYFPGFFVVFLVALSFSAAAQPDTSGKRQFIVFPVIARSIETGWAFGGAGSVTFRPSAKDTVSRTSNAQVLAIYTTKKQLVAAINGTQYFNKERYILSEQFTFSSFPDKFWGLGINSPDEAEESYQFKQFYTYLHLMRRISPHFFAGGIYEFQKVWDIQYDAAGIFDQQNIAGRKGYQVSGLGTSLTYDSRNSAFSPDKGGFAQIFFNHFDPVFGSDFAFTNVVVDLRKYIHTGRQRILALQLYSFNNIGDEIPLRNLASLGGMNRMRGYYEGRYRDHQELIVQTEYRIPVYKRFGMVAFGGAGTVNDRFKNLRINQLKYSFGAGLRYAINKSERLNIRLDYGVGSGNNRGFYLQIGEAF